MEEGVVRWVMRGVKGAKPRRLYMPSESLLFRRRSFVSRNAGDGVMGDD
jgi:hypothetical protein